MGGARVGDYFALLKPKVMSLVVFTALIGLLLAPGEIHPVVAAIAILCIALGGGASGALNMWYDSDIDAVMSRTANRPIPSGRVERDDALTLGLVLSFFSVVTLGLATNWFAAGFLAFTIFFYAVVYSMWLKRSTPQNIVIGGAAGAFPPMVGWAAVTGGVSLEGFVLFLIVFLWTPPHFWALALYKQGDYGAAGVPMLPNVAGEQATKVQILVYSVLLVASTLAPQVLGFAGWLYTSVAVVTGASFLWLAVKLYRTGADTQMRRTARQLFTYSLSYLFIIFLALITDYAMHSLGVL
ncbi:protoheme IX farnesyltransferase [Arsenicitalea aurantiaca]|uniref:Protoheme IX farnesyltransferase n=1 Tax=Arsenicitalea aurantiaca TaxID=1783274 RepID=A0A433XC16_9HYPH|nr:heme o synthase [Arsenicitalea aurantiaca]RUT31448.1 protoheme IX farnesyltransferase [Arsenicitalea aurantiaca]